MQTEMQELIQAAYNTLSGYNDKGAYCRSNTTCNCDRCAARKILLEARELARKASEVGWIEPGSCKNCGHSEHGKCMAWAGNGLGWCKCENYEPVPLLSLETPEVTS